MSHLLAYGQPVTQCFDFAIVQRMRSRLTVLESLDVQHLALEIHVRELELACLTNAQPVTHHQENQSVVTLGIACEVLVLGRRQKLADFLLRKVFSTSFTARADIRFIWRYHSVHCLRQTLEGVLSGIGFQSGFASR